MIQRLRNACAYLFIAPFAVSFFSFVILPFFVALGLAFVKLDLTSHEPVAFVGLKNFQEALSDQYFWKAVWATSYFVVMAVPLTVVLSTAVAVGNAQHDQQARQAHRSCDVVPAGYGQTSPSPRSFGSGSTTASSACSIITCRNGGSAACLGSAAERSRCPPSSS